MTASNASIDAASGGPVLLKMLDLERRRQFDNGSVSGGLDAYLRGALAQAAPEDPLFTLVAALPQEGYASLSPGERATWVRGAQARILGTGRGSTASNARTPAQTNGARKPRAAQTGSSIRSGPARQSGGAAGPAATDGGLSAPVSVLGRMRAPTLERLARVGVHSVRDLLCYFPNRHVDFTNVKRIADLVVGDEATVLGRVRTSRVARLGGRRRAAEATLEDESGRIRAIWFNQAFLAKQFTPGARVGLAGKVTGYRGRPQFESPEWEILYGDGAETAHVGRLAPVYPLTQGLPGRTVRRLAWEAVSKYAQLTPESLPAEILAETDYLPEAEALRQLHFPDSIAQREAARERLAFQELLAIQVAILRRKREARARADAPVIQLRGDFLQEFVQALPFQLTNAQIKAITQIRSDLARAEPMARLLQGDVGSGKTVVAAAAMLGTVAAGYQAALMAPTEILAEQHYRTFNRIFGGDAEGSVFHNYTVSPALGRPVRMALLTGSSSAGDKRKIREALKRGELDIVMGTHALIQERVSLERLGLAVVDEQHRFGVLQRDALRGKGGSPHLLVMTATPIPRTLALTVYGDLEATRLDEMPPGRMPVETHFATPDDRQQVYAQVREQIAAGRQAFIICPLVEESEAVEAKAAVQEFERLRSEVFPELAARMRLLHGRMATQEKDATMRAIREGEAYILVSTSVIEVGVDIPNATIMVIEGADRFGLAQLHQFRGRVGRAEHQSYCYLLSGSEGDAAQTRLRMMERTSDGFELAEADLSMRGPGEYFGTRQSGMPDLRVAKLTDHALLLKARNFAERILDRDPNLRAPEHQPLTRQALGISVEGAEAVH